MLNFYRLVSLVPETDCLISSKLSEFDNTNQSTINHNLDANNNNNNELINDSSIRPSTLGELLIPCLDLIDTIQLSADIRLASIQQIQKRQIFQSKVNIYLYSLHCSLICLLLLFILFINNDIYY